MLYLLKGPFVKDGRKYVVIQDGNRKRTMTYARYLYQKETGERLKPWVEVHHKDLDKTHDEISNLEKQKYYKHEELHDKAKEKIQRSK